MGISEALQLGPFASRNYLLYPIHIKSLLYTLQHYRKFLLQAFTMTQLRGGRYKRLPAAGYNNLK